MALSLRNLLIKTPALLLTRENATVPEEGFEEITEAMAEKLADRVPKLLKGLDALQKKNRASQHDTIELQKWVDKENEALLNLRKTIGERQRSYLKTLSEDSRALLVSRHPVWVTNFNLSLDQIHNLFAIHRNENTIVHCVLKTNTLKSLTLFYYSSVGKVLCINSNKDLQFISSESPDKNPAEGGIAPWHNNGENQLSGEYIFRPIPGGHAQWTFTGNRWGIENHIVWLDFGKSKSD